jgi:hypothetical protein
MALAATSRAPEPSVELCVWLAVAHGLAGAAGAAAAGAGLVLLMILMPPPAGLAAAAGAGAAGLGAAAAGLVAEAPASSFTARVRVASSSSTAEDSGPDTEPLAAPLALGRDIPPAATGRRKRGRSVAADGPARPAAGPHAQVKSYAAQGLIWPGAARSKRRRWFTGARLCRPSPAGSAFPERARCQATRRRGQGRPLGSTAWRAVAEPAERGTAGRTVQLGCAIAVRSRGR